MINYLFQFNYFSIIASSVFYFVLGAFWYCPIFGTLKMPILLPGTARRKELKRNNILIKDLTDNEALFKIIITFCATLVASFAMSYLVIMVNSTSLFSGLFLGTLVAVGFSVVTLGISYTWENRSFKLFIIDSLCPLIGIITSAIILSIWR